MVRELNTHPLQFQFRRGEYLKPVGSYAPNGYGLYDMSGNVLEWCSDWYNRDYYSKSPERNPKGGSIGTMRVIRGGAYDNKASNLRCAYRLYLDPLNYGGVGFRCVYSNSINKQPSVIYTDPIDGVQLPFDIRCSQVSVRFDVPIQPALVSILVEGIKGQTDYDGSTQTVTFIANEPLKSGKYMVTVSGAMNLVGNVMSPYTFTFTIEEVVKIDWYTVQEGDTLPSIAAKPEVYGDESKWKLILDAN